MFSIRNLTRAELPRLPYANIARRVLGKKIAPDTISITFIGSRRSRELNRLYRQKDKPANILTFSLTIPLMESNSNEGEILIDLTTSRLEAKHLEVPLANYLRHLFIHGLLHLKGLSHGSRMETLEQRIIKFFTRYGQNHCYRTGRRHRISKSRRL